MKLYKRLSVILSMGIMGIGLISFSTVTGDQALGATDAGADNNTVIVRDLDENGGSKSTDIPTPTATPTQMPTPTPEPNYLMKNSNNKITNLVQNYLNAKLECTREAFEGIVTDTSYIDPEKLQIQTETVLSYELIDCYTKRGYGPVDYVVYYTYNMNIATLTSPAFAVDALYVQVDDNGDYKVFLGRLDDDIEADIDALSESEDVKAVVDDIMAQIDKAMDEDETLKQYWQRLYDSLREYIENEE